MLKNKINLNGVSEENKRKNEVQVIFEAIMAENFYKLNKETNLHIQGRYLKGNPLLYSC